MERGLEQGIERGLEKGRREAAKRLQKYGMKPREIAKALGLPLGTVSRYLKTTDKAL
ncbi:MAG: helix-turn-helix domain-containing protein [Treponema sp.]|nr:helix-turn-helix domain-containing protein [Treponema sp.]